MIVIAAGVLDRAGEQLGGFLPRLGGALALLVVGLLAARLIGRLLRKALAKADADKLAVSWGITPVLQRAGLGDSLSALLGVLARVGLSVVVILATLSLLGLQFLDQALNQAILLLPNILLAGALLLAGIVLGGLARERLDRVARQMDIALPVGTIAQIVVVCVFGLTAAAQVGVSTALLMLLVGVLLVAAFTTLSLAFGLGGRELARELTAGRSLRGAYRVGQVISFDGMQGRIVSFETTATVLGAEDGRTLRVPNYRLLGAVVTVHDGPETP